MRIDELGEADDFVKALKLTGQFESLIEQFVRDRLTVLAARKQGIPVSPDEIQERADQFRRASMRSESAWTSSRPLSLTASTRKR